MCVCYVAVLVGIIFLYNVVLIYYNTCMYNSNIYITGTEEHVKCKIIETDAAVVLRPVVYNQPPDIIVALLKKPAAICYSYLAAIMYSDIEYIIELFCVVTD